MRSALAHVPKGQQTMVAAALRQAFLRFGPAEGHVTIDLTASANSPSTH